MSESSGPAHRPSAVAGPWSVPVLFRERRPRVVVKADLLPAVSVVGVLTVLSFPLAFVWSRLAPAERVRIVAADGTQGALELESWHRFDDLAVFGFLALGLGVVAGVVVWLLRERRGPVVFLAAVLGVALAAALAKLLGPSFANAHYAIATPPAVGEVIELAPRLESWWVLLTGPLGVSIAYSLLATWNGRDDLGRRLG
ncbi:DUF2567 domain-containing protein [Amycolatopsis rifamycinica]|uniref:DUF2567 domain-containing protein n=1 Tax=Amycolatopsis rifamycinica TaxID=287986 RepID=A0A066U096_9PSEU|nr:DUF2567 domain-containing protein [Amycolatopsis rifamycinica]KDN20871.1 hypothetical protein DV20_17995 [Amycolatopsis rifamycinica]